MGATNQVGDPNHYVATLYPYGKNGIYWAWPRPPAPATEAKCWEAIEQAMANDEIDFDKFKG